MSRCMIFDCFSELKEKYQIKMSANTPTVLNRLNIPTWMEECCSESFTSNSKHCSNNPFECLILSNWNVCIQLKNAILIEINQITTTTHTLTYNHHISHNCGHRNHSYLQLSLAIKFNRTEVSRIECNRFIVVINATISVAQVIN